MTVDDLNDFYFFSEVAQHGGFSAAARALKIPKSRLSRRIAELEARLGVQLLQRTTRQLHLTAIGEDFLRHCRAMVTEAQAAQEVIERGLAEPGGRLRVACPVTLAQRVMAPLLPGFLARHPRIQLELEVGNRRVDVVAEGYDVALRVRTPPLRDGELVAKPLGSVHRHLVAAPALLAPRAPLREPSHLATLPSLGFSSPDGRQRWRLRAPDGLLHEVEHHPLLVTDDMDVQLGAALAGLGVAMLPALVCGPALRDGRLVPLLTDWRAPHELAYAV